MDNILLLTDSYKVCGSWRLPDFGGWSDSRVCSRVAIGVRGQPFGRLDASQSLCVGVVLVVGLFGLLSVCRAPP